MATGPSTTTAPYLIAVEPNVTLTAIATVGDVIGTKADGVTPYRFVGIPDGLGAFDNGDGTITVLINHELTATSGVVREHGAIGAFVSQLTIDKTTLAVTGAEDAIKSVELWNDATDAFEIATYAIARLCSADLAPVSAYYWVDDQGTVDTLDDIAYGTEDRIFMTGEETGSEGKQFGVAITGANAGTAYELANLGLFSWENSLTSPFAQKKTINISTDDSGGGEVYVYIGEKQTTGNAVEKAGLVGGDLFGIKVSNLAGAANTESNTLAANGTFTLVKLGADEDLNGTADGNVSDMTGVQLEAQSAALGVASFLRPEDGHFDPTNPNVFWFVTTADIAGQSRLYKMTFTDIANPELGGTIVSVLDSNQIPVNGTIGPRMMDNMVVTDEGKIIIQEDPGGNLHYARVLEYDPATDTLTEIARHDPALFTTGLPGLITIDEEASGVIDVTDMLGVTGAKAYLMTDQIHANLADPELVQMGQLTLMTVADVTDGTTGDDLLNGDGLANTFSGLAGNDTINGGSGNDTIDGGDDEDTAVYGNAFSAYTTARTGNVITITDARGSDTVTNVENFQFANGTYANIGTSGTEDTAYTVSAADLLEGFTDPNGLDLVISGLSVTNGVVVDNLDGTFTVTPNANVNGAQTLSYTVTDSNATATAALFGFTLASVNDAPTAIALSNTTIAENRNNGTVVGTLSTTDVDHASGFTYALLDNAGGAFSLNTTTGAIFVSNGNLLNYEAAQTMTITVKSTDAAGGTVTQNLTINLTNVVENQTYTGTTGADAFTAPSDDNWTVDAKGGADIITTGTGADVIFGAGGNDTISTGGGNDSIVFTGGSGGFDAVDGGTGTDTILANANNTVIGLSSISGIEAISSGGFANVKIMGTTGADNFDFSGTTLSGIVSIGGGAGSDAIIGSTGDDRIIGGAGADVLTGFSGADVFVFNATSESGIGAKADRILDFVAGVDKLDLTGIDAIAGVLGKQAFTFIGSDDFTALGQVRIGTANGHVVVSANTAGNLAADFSIVLDSNPALTINDFVLGLVI